MPLMAHSCTASGARTLEAHGSCGGRVIGAKWQERCWSWRGCVAAFDFKRGWTVSERLTYSHGWLFAYGIFGFWGCSGVYRGCIVGALIWMKMELGFQVKWSLSWLEALIVEWGLWWFKGYFWVFFRLERLSKAVAVLAVAVLAKEIMFMTVFKSLSNCLGLRF